MRGKGVTRRSQHMMDPPRVSQDCGRFRHAVQPSDTASSTEAGFARALLEAIRKSGIAEDRGGVVGQHVEKSSRLKTGEVERKDDMWHWRPANLEISLIAQIARAAGTGWINQDSASKGVDPVVR